MARLIDGDYVLSALSIFNDREHGSEHFLYGIETAKEIVENAPTVTGWISVKDALPTEIGLYCWVWGNGWEEPDLDWCDGSSGFYRNSIAEVTHWMPCPLPEPPEEVSE